MSTTIHADQRVNTSSVLYYTQHSTEALVYKPLRVQLRYRYSVVIS
jgi:hypothetical protein